MILHNFQIKKEEEIEEEDTSVHFKIFKSFRIIQVRHLIRVLCFY